MFDLYDGKVTTFKNVRKKLQEWSLAIFDPKEVCLIAEVTMFHSCTWCAFIKSDK